MGSLQAQAWQNFICALFQGSLDRNIENVNIPVLILHKITCHNFQLFEIPAEFYETFECQSISMN